MSKGIMHIKELNAGSKFVQAFINAANRLADKKGCLLIQFPGKITLEHRRDVEKTISDLDKANSKNEWRNAAGSSF